MSRYWTEEVQKTARGVFHPLILGVDGKIYAELKHSVNSSSRILVNKLEEGEDHHSRP